MKPELEDLRCDDCAFREGTQANSQQSTVMKAQLCAEIPEEFHCHRREGLCAGWAALANKLNREGYHANQPDWQRKLKQELVEIINNAERGNIGDISHEIMLAIDKVGEKEKAEPEVPAFAAPALHNHSNTE